MSNTRVCALLPLVIMAVVVSLSASTAIIEPVSSYKGPEGTSSRMPIKTSVEKAKKASCLIVILGQYPRFGSGVLIKPKLVVTSMHTLAASSKSPAVAASSIRVFFDKTKVDNPETATGFVKVSRIDPVPPNTEVMSISKDFAVLELADSATKYGGSVAEVLWDWGKTGGDKTKADKGFLVHWPRPVKSTDPSVMNLSFAADSEKASILPNVDPWGFLGPLKISWPVFKEFDGSSGGGVFEDRGQLVGIIKGHMPEANPAMNQLPKYTIGLPIDNIVDATYGSQLARQAFSSTNKATISERIHDFLYITIGNNSMTDGKNDATSPHLAASLKWFRITGGQVFSVDLTDVTSKGAEDGYYKLTIYARGSVSLYNKSLCDYKNQIFAALSISGTGNTIEGKTTLTAGDLSNGRCPTPVTFSQDQSGSPVSVPIEFKLRITTPSQAKLTLTTGGGLDAGLGAGFSIHWIAAERTSDLNGNTTGTGGRSDNKYWKGNLVLVLNDPNVAPGVYVQRESTGSIFTLDGRLLSTTPSTDYQIFTDLLTASFVGQTHQFDKYDIYWGDGTIETVSQANYKGKVQSHRYSQAGTYKIEAKYRYKDLFNDVYEDLIHKPAVEIGELRPDVSAPRMSFVPAGTGIGGTPIPALYVGQTEVTQSGYYLTTKKCPFDRFSVETARHPAENVTFYDAILYCNARSAAEGLQTVYSFSTPTSANYSGVTCISLANLQENRNNNGYRLPTPEEWSYCYLGGGTGPYYWGNQADAQYFCWSADNAAGSTQEVSQKVPNTFRLYDMSGNVEEWTYSPSTSMTAKAAGGCFLNHVFFIGADLLRFDGGWQAEKKASYRFLGFRVVRNAPPAPQIDFSLNKRDGFMPLQTIFTPASYGGPVTNWLWNFGDGVLSDDESPQHVYNQPGVYSITQTAFGPGGIVDNTKSDYVLVRDHYYEESFVYHPQQGGISLPEQWGFSSVKYFTVPRDDDGSATYPYASTYLKTASPGDWSAISEAFTPEFFADRKLNGGVEVRWKVKLPTEYSSSWRENNKVYVALCNASNCALYELMFKPNRAQDQYTSFDLELVKKDGSNSTVLKQGWSHTLTPHGTGAPFLQFKWILKTDGTIVVSYDNGTGSSIEYLKVNDNTYQEFSKLQFRYKTGTQDGGNYFALIDDIEVERVVK